MKTGMRLVAELEALAPAYAAIHDDGAPLRCRECIELGHSSTMWYVVTPDGQKRVFHKDCVDSDWLKKATKVEGQV